MVRRLRAVPRNNRRKNEVAVKLRLMRMGKKKQPTYRVVAADTRSPRNGRFIEILGTYDPRQEPSVVKIDTDKANDWISKGAQPTETVARLIKVAEAQPAADEGAAESEAAEA
jgi:small subunit ribosomal protein S16